MASNRPRIIEVPGVIRIVGSGPNPTAIEDAEIDALRQIVHSGSPSSPWKFLARGERMKIVRGPLRGLEGIFVENKSISVMVLNVVLLQRAVAVQVHRDDVLPCSNHCPRPDDFVLPDCRIIPAA
jgi:transcription antitermination factor NusG